MIYYKQNTQGANLPMNDHISECKNIYYNHIKTEKIPCNAYSMHTHSMYELIFFLEGDRSPGKEQTSYDGRK